MTQIITLDELLLNALQDLEQKDFKLFKWHLCQNVLLEFEPFRKACLEDVEREDTVTKMMERYLREGALTVAIAILRKMNQNDLAEKLEEEKNKLPPTPVREKTVVTADRIIAKHNLRLMKRVKVVDRIAKILLSKGFIQSEMYSKICSASTSIEKIWYLMKALNAGGSSAKSAFIDTLNEMEPSLLEDQDEGDGDIESSHEKEESEAQQEEKEGGKKSPIFKFWEKSNTKQEELAEQVENTPKEETDSDQKGETEVDPLTLSNSKSGLLSFGIGKFNKQSTPKTVPQVSEEEDKKDMPKDVQTKGEKEEASRVDNKAKVSSKL
ncbi:hypothetical protein MATL_G00011660 [Megalops atlanticus]|uniref:CARD domain-containing protein n=1 Tax=Megalops atlanticus TaxID=7932 RepID=A0A9D3THN2_MEGAT|nr:hypothetical protein MATL_G00011660 [Megalops atlanticus]